ncbi:MAG: ATP-binding protein [Desulfatibacillum sp.]|nr:ATP-binding protein [Desulfatibacillum sp.]
MLIKFTLENWMSFKTPVTFSMIATQERQHGERLSRVNKYQARILPVAAIYGGNASGKSNLVLALRFAKRLVVKGTQPDNLIPVEPFRLNDSCMDHPSRFVFEILVNESIYEYAFSVTREGVVEERLVLITSSSEKVLFDRKDGKPNFHSSLKNKDFLKFAFKGTRDNQLFLTNAVSQKVNIFRPIYDWFKNSLVLILPESQFEPFEQFLDQDHPLYSTMNALLAQLDTGISRLGGEDVPFDSLGIPEGFKTRLQEEIKEDVVARIMDGEKNERYFLKRSKGELQATKMVSFHARDDGTEARFEIQHESDGSRRVIDLLPAFLEISAPEANRVFVIDELDRSLHTLLIRQLIEFFLKTCSPESRAQLLFTTHDVLLMDQQLLRRDEMWVTERDTQGISDLFSFSEYKDVRYDKDLRKSYLQGRLGGIPRILFGGTLATHCAVKGKGENG